MQWWIQLTEIIRNWALLIGGAAGLYLAWRRVTAANRQAEAQIRQADVQRRNYELLSAYVRENPQRWGEGEPPLDVREIFRFLETKLEQDR